MSKFFFYSFLTVAFKQKCFSNLICNLFGAYKIQTKQINKFFNFSLFGSLFFKAKQTRYEDKVKRE